MAYAVIFERLAQADLQDIDSYLSVRSPKGAESVARDIFAAIDVLSSFPFASRPLIGSSVRYRSTQKYKYRIFFEVDGMELRILGIRHPRSGSPDPEQI
jgi:plasmid stabilization system protein ParE